MAPLDVDASNPCVPPSHPLVASVPPLPSTTRGQPLVLDGKAGRINGDRPVLLYTNGRLVVVRELEGDLFEEDEGSGDKGGKGKWKGGMDRPMNVKAFVYRGHTAQVTAAMFSPSGCYVASADARGQLRVWAYDNEEHLCRLELATAMAGPIRDISWDLESRRLCLVGEGSKTDASSECARVIQWDTGVTCGELGQHTRNRAVSCAFKPNRPMRIATGGGEDSRVLFNKGPPFVRVVDGAAAEGCHERGAVHCLRYSPDGSKLASAGTDRSVVLYDGGTMALLGRMEDVHANSVYSCDWSSDGKFLLTCSADGTAKLIDADTRKVAHVWNLLEEQRRRALGEEGAAAAVAAAAASPMLSPSSSGGMTSPSGVARRSSSSGSSSQFRPDMGGMQMGAAFVAGDVPVAVSLNGEIAALPVPADIMTTSKAAAGSEVKFLTGHQAPISAMASDPNSGKLYTGDTDGVICAWELSSGAGGGGGKRRGGGGGRGGPSVVALGRVERRSGGGGSSEGESADSSLMGRVHNGAITALTCVNGSVLSAGWDDALRIGDEETALWRVGLEAQPNAMGRGTELVAVVTVRGLLLVKDNAVVSRLIELPYSTLSVCVSSDDSTVIVGGEDCNIRVYSVDSSSGPQSLDLNEIRTIEGGHLKPVHALSLSPDGTYLASADVRDVLVWNVADDFAPVIGKSRWCFHTQRIACLAWSSEGSLLASGGNDDSIYLWSLAKKTKRVHYAFAHRGGISGLEFMGSGGADGGMILMSAGADGCVNMWDVADDVAKKFG